MSSYHACLLTDSRYSSPAANGKSVSFSRVIGFDGINVTAQHLMAQTAPLMRLFAFYSFFFSYAEC